MNDTNDNSGLIILGAIIGLAVLSWGLGYVPDADTQGLELEPLVVAAPEILYATPAKHLEMIDPVYSEKAVYVDEIIMVAFRVPLTSEGIARSELNLQLENRSGGVIQVLWDECSIQLPGADTVNIMHEEMRYDSRSFSSPPTSIAPGGDLLETVVPISEVCTAEEGYYYITDDIFDNGEFHFVLAIRLTDPTCEGPSNRYYHFRFVIR